MKSVAFEGKIDSYQGRSDWKRADGTPFVFPIKFSGTAEVYADIHEAKEAGAWPNEQDIFEALVDKKVTSAKAAEYQKQTKEIKDAYENSNDFKSANLVKAAILAGFSPAEAEALAASKLS